MTSSTGNDTKDCYGQLRDLLGNSQENSTSFKKDTAAGFIVGAGSAAREAVPALDKLGLNPIFILHYDSGEMWAGRIIKRQGLLPISKLTPSGTPGITF